MSIESLREQASRKSDQTWVVCGPQGVYWVGLCQGETHAWTIALGWPDEADIQAHKQRGWYAQRATVSWPAKEPASDLDHALHTLQPFVHGLGKAILADVSDEIKALRQQAACRAPEGYALIGIDALKSWGKLDEVEAACQFQFSPSQPGRS